VSAVGGEKAIYIFRGKRILPLRSVFEIVRKKESVLCTKEEERVRGGTPSRRCKTKMEGGGKKRLTQ